MSWLKGLGKVLAGLICLGLAEICRRLTFICPDWRGQMSPEVAVSAIFLLMVFGFFAGGASLIYEVYGDFREGRRRRAERLQRNRERTFRFWLSTFPDN